jgi:hypothetical protein
MRVVSSKEQSGIWSNSRSYFVKDELLLTEVDGNGDGVFETMVLYHPNQKDMEVFKTQSGGSLRPVHTKLLQAYKLEHAALNGFWDKAFDTNDKSKLEMLFRKTQKDIEEATRHRKQLEANDPDGAVNRSR